jgi:hypothetical protein
MFDGTQESSFLQFGRSGDTDRPKGILKGRISLTGMEVKSIFDGVINRIVNSVIRLAGTRKVQVSLHDESPSFVITSFHSTFYLLADLANHPICGLGSETASSPISRK